MEYMKLAFLCYYVLAILCQGLCYYEASEGKKNLKKALKYLKRAAITYGNTIGSI